MKERVLLKKKVEELIEIIQFHDVSTQLKNALNLHLICPQKELIGIKCGAFD